MEDKTNISQIVDIMYKIDYHENRIRFHKRAINKLRKEKSVLMAKGREIDEDERITDKKMS